MYWKVQQNSSEKINFVILRNLLNLKIFWRQNLPESKWPPVKQLYLLSCGGREETRENNSETLNFADNAVTEGLNVFSLSVQCLKKRFMSFVNIGQYLFKSFPRYQSTIFNILFFRPSSSLLFTWSLFKTKSVVKTLKIFNFSACLDIFSCRWVKKYCQKYLVA